MSLRNKHLFTSAGITAFAVTLLVLAIHFFTGGRSFYEAGITIIFAGIALAVIVIPLFYRSHHRARLHINLHLPVEERNRLVSDPYYDYFAGVALGVVLITLVGFGIITLASKLEGRQSSSTNLPSVGSVKAELPNLYERAHQWRSDAYLVELDYNFGRMPVYDWHIISASYMSPSKPETLFVVEITTAGAYVTDFYNFPVSSHLPTPISDDNWTIDSQEAVSIFAQDENVKACLNFDRKKSLELTSQYSLENDQVKWCLKVEECSATSYLTL